MLATDLLPIDVVARRSGFAAWQTRPREATGLKAAQRPGARIPSTRRRVRGRR